MLFSIAAMRLMRKLRSMIFWAIWRFGSVTGFEVGQHSGRVLFVSGELVLLRNQMIA
jgi:hypothetical protein